MKRNLSEARNMVRNILNENLTLRDLTLSDLKSVALPIKMPGIDQLNVNLPNAGEGLTRINLNSEYAQRNLDYYKEELVDKVDKLKKEKNKDDSILDSKIILNPEEVWYKKVVIDDEDFREKKETYRLDESKLRTSIQSVLNEIFWTDEEWNAYLGDHNKPKQKELNDDILDYVESDFFKKNEALEYIMSLAKKVYLDKNEYDLVDFCKISLKNLKDDLMDKNISNKVSSILDEFEYKYQMVNEVVSAVSDTPNDDQIDVQESISEELKSCPIPTQDLEINTKNRDSSIKAEYIKYGPLNVDEPGDYWKDLAEHWDTTEKAAKKSLCGNCVAFDISKRMDECMPGPVSDKDGRLGYCWMHNFKCHSARTCRTWAKGGPITENKVSYEWQERESKK